MKTFTQIREELNESTAMGPFGDPYGSKSRAKDAHDDHQKAINHHEHQKKQHAIAQARAERHGNASKAEHHEEAGMEHHFAAEAHRDAQKLLKKHGPDHHKYEAEADSAHNMTRELK